MRACYFDQDDTVTEVKTWDLRQKEDFMLRLLNVVSRIRTIELQDRKKTVQRMVEAGRAQAEKRKNLRAK